jgi:hypothetical protein
MHAGQEKTTEAVPEAEVAGEVSRPSVRRRGPGHLAAWLALGLGVAVTVVNIALAIRIWKFIFARAASGSLLFSLMLAGFVLGLFLIAYGVILALSRARRVEGDDAGPAATNDAPAQGVWYLSIVVSVLVAAGAFAITIWAANVIEPDQPQPQNPKTCIDLYQQAIALHEASPSYRLLPTDPDQRRCDVNGFLRYIGK